jgi:hypothetical protein
MQWSEIPFHPPARTLRQFAGLWLVVFGGMAAWQFFGRGDAAAAAGLVAVAATIGPLGLAFPSLIRPVFVAWMVLAFPIGWTVSRLILATIYYGLFTPMALAFRLIGRDALDRTRRPSADSYWSAKPAPASLRDYFRQF